jgi:hypothetical protein
MLSLTYHTWKRILCKIRELICDELDTRCPSCGFYAPWQISFTEISGCGIFNKTNIRDVRSTPHRLMVLVEVVFKKTRFLRTWIQKSNSLMRECFIT